MAPRVEAIGEERRAHAESGSLIDLVAHRIDGQRNAARIAAWRAGNRVNPRLQRIERLNERLRVGPDAGKLAQRREHIETCGIAVRIIAGCKPFRLFAAHAAGHVGDELEQHVGGRRQRYAVDQLFAQRAPANRKIRRRGERRQHLGDQLRIVGRENADGIADDVIKSGPGQVDFDVPGLFFRSRPAEAVAREECRFRRPVARVARRRLGR